MVGALLADRFQLRTHPEMRRLGVYSLVQQKSGSKMKPSANAAHQESGSVDGEPGNWQGYGVTGEELASNLAALPELGGRSVIDNTSLSGKFDFTLKWTPDPAMGAGSAGPESGVKSDPAAPSLLTALKEQLGLKLETAKEPVEVVVVDSAEMPAPD
jgi:uncharacterized protein (TIGR03435 family)